MPNKKQLRDPAHDRILAAAGTLIARYGYTEATFEKIARQAGVSRGLLHYHFATKEQMFAEVIRRNQDRSVEKLQRIFERCDSARALANRLADTFAQLFDENPESFAIFVEGLGTARHSRVVAGEISRSYRQYRTALQEGLQALAGRGVIKPALPVRTVAMMYMSVLDGACLALATVAGDEVGDEIWAHLKRGLRALVE